MPRTTTRQRDSVQVDRLFVSPNAFGDTWYVDTGSGNDANSGLDPRSAFATLDAARSASAAGDIIVIAPGTYTQTAAEEPLTPKANQTWMAAKPNGRGQPSVVIEGTAEATVVDVEVAGVVFEGIEFQADADAVVQIVDVSETATVKGLTFRNCWFNANGKTTVVGLNADDGTFIVTGLYVTGCRFTQCDTGLKIGVKGFGQSVIEDNIFECQLAADIGIDLADTSEAGPTGWVIRNNDFTGALDGDADGLLAIKIAGTSNAIGVGIIRTNYLGDFAEDAITQDIMEEMIVENYYGEADGATGGTKITGGA